MAQIELTEDNSESVSVEIKEPQPDGIGHEIGVTAGLVAADQDRDPVEAYATATASRDIPTMLSVVNEQTTDNRLQLMESLLTVSTVDSVKSEASQLVQDMSGDNGVLGPYKQQIRSMPSSVGKTDREIKELALLQYQRESLGQFQSSGVWDVVSDIGGIFWPKRKAEAVIDVAVREGYVSGTSDKGKIAFDSTRALNKLNVVFKSLQDPEEKALFIKSISESIDLATDNNLIKTEMLANIVGEGTTKFDTAFEMLDNVVVGQIVASTARVVKGLVRAGSILVSLKKMGASETAADVISNAASNPVYAQRLGITKADIADTKNPLQGSSESFQAEVTHMIDLQDARLKSITELANREGVLDRTRMEEVMRAAEIKQLKIPGITHAKVVANDETGFKLQWAEELFTESGKPRVKLRDRQIDFKLNDQGKIESPLDEYDSFLKTDPNARMFGKLREWFVGTVERLARTQERTAFNFDGMMRDAFKGLKKKGAVKVDEVLLNGSKEGKVYTFDELTTSGIGANSLKLSEGEAKAYYGVRNVVNHMFSLKNKQISDGYLATGVKLVDNFDGVVPAKVFDDVASAFKNWNSLRSDSLWVNVADDGLKIGEAPVQLLKFGNKSSFTKEMLEEAYSKGYVLAKNHTSSGFFIRGTNKTQWGLVRKESVVSPRGQQVLNKLPGYMPKQRTNSYYFIKSERGGVLSGAAKNFKVGETVAWSDSARTADKWIAAQDDPSKFIKVFDRELTAEQASAEISATHGGLYSGARKSTELPYVGDESAQFANSFESMQHYINHIGRQYPASLYRLGSEQRMLEIAKSLGVKDARGVHDVLDKARISGLRESSKEFKLLEDIQSQVSFINMIPTTEELKFAKRYENLAVALDGPLLKKIPGWNKVPKFFYNKASENTHPADILRGITFNHLLGMYNPAQILVQFSGALVSFAVSPVHFTKALPRAMGWSVLDNLASDPLSQARAIKWMQKNNLSEFAEDYQLWSKSGYRESVVNGNADYTSVFMKNLPYDANIVQKAVSNHTVFYKMGELANTRAAFSTAIERYKAANKLSRVDANDVDALHEISRDAEVLRLNMSRANQSDLNKGWKSVPLQFQQVITKYFEKLLPKGFGGTDELTGPEKMRLIAVPTAITGFAGIPVASWLSIKMLDMMGIDETELSPGQTQAIKFGALGWMMSEALELNTDFSSRMTLGGDVIRSVYDSIVQQRAVWQWLGATGTVSERYYRNGQFLAEAFDLSVLKNEQVNMDSLKFMASVLRDAAIDIPTLSRNFKQYSSYFFTQNPQFIKDGQYLFDLETMNKKTAFFGIMGFQPQEIAELYEVDKEINEGRAAINKFGDTDVALITRVLSTHILNESSSVESQALGALMVNSILTKYGQIEAAEIMSGVWDKKFSKRFDQDDLLFKFLLESEKRMQEGLDVYNTMISRKLFEGKQVEGQQ